MMITHLCRTAYYEALGLDMSEPRPSEAHTGKYPTYEWGFYH